MEGGGEGPFLRTGGVQVALDIAGSQEVLNQWLDVQQTLQHGVHEASVSQVLQAHLKPNLAAIAIKGIMRRHCLAGEAIEVFGFQLASR